MASSLRFSLALVSVLAIFQPLLSASEPADLVVFPESLPEAPHVYDAESAPIIRLDKVSNPSQPGITLVGPEKSTFKKPEALMAYDAHGATLLIHVIDDAEVNAPATRTGQERFLSTPSMPGVPVSKPTKIKVKPAGASDAVIDGYLTRRDPKDPLLTLIVPDSTTGKDRFVVQFTWLSARDDRAEQMAEWLPKAAATINLAKLQALR